MKIRSKTSSKDYLNNYDRIFKKGPKNIEEVDKSLHAKAKRALDKVIENPDLALNPVVILAVEHIHDELEQLETQQENVEIQEITEEPIEFYSKRRRRKKHA